MADCEKLGSKPNGFERRGQAWFCTTGLPSDIVIDVDAMSFHLHKFPLTSRSGKFARLVAAHSADDNDEVCCVTLSDAPGGAETFELAAKFCYGMKLEITPFNVAALYSLAHYLEMTEEYGEGNLLARAETFLNQVVLRNWKSSVQALKGCDIVLRQAEELQIVKKCVDSIAMKACTDPNLLGWPMGEHEGLHSPGGSILWNGISTGARYRHPNSDWWIEDIAALSLPLFELVITGMAEKTIRPETIAGAVMHYATEHIPGLTRRKGATNSTTIFRSSAGSVGENDERRILEALEELLPFQKNIVPVKFLLGMLKTAIILSASETCRSGLEKRIGMQLEQASIDDLFIPTFTYTAETLYDVECVQRIVQNFVCSEQQAAPGSIHVGAEVEEGAFISSPCPTPLTQIGKLLDNFLAEVASDPHLKPEKFQSLAESVPKYARLYDDGLYRAIDFYLQEHRWLTEAEKEKLCSIIDCQKLTLEACTHAAQNERLPLRLVVQVLFFEQLQLRNAIAGTYIAADVVVAPPPTRPSRVQAMSDLGTIGSLPMGSDCWNHNNTNNSNSNNNNNANSRDNHQQALQMDMDTIKSKVSVLERQCSAMRQTIQKMKTAKEPFGSWALNVISKFGCKFKSHLSESRRERERTIVASSQDMGKISTMQLAKRSSIHRRTSSVA